MIDTNNTRRKKMKIQELNGNAIKKALGIKKAYFRWHNKNKTWGNFGINLEEVNGIDCEISGSYNENKDIISLCFGRMYQAGIAISERNFEYLMDMIKRTTLNVSKLITE